MFTVEKPVNRSPLRRVLGKEYFCLKEKMRWHLSGTKFAAKRSSKPLKFQWFWHQSILLRQLKDVDMQLQYNKIVNLKLAVEKLNGILIQPGETFSVWKLVG